tara:strand:+ start:6731 stop:7402 length:672 start_codon:yes stop_codon:yes gene_type:complete
MPRKYTDGPASITAFDDDVRAALDTLGKGLPGLIIRETEKELLPIMAAAAANWPVRYKRSRNSRGSFRFFSVIQGNKLQMGIENTAKQSNGKGYAWFVRYSRRDRASLERELKTVEGIAREAQAYASGIEARGVFQYQFVTKARELAEEQQLQLPPLGRTRSPRGLMNLYRDKLFSTHGRGAERRVIAGRSIWAAMVRKPGRKASTRLVDRLQAEITALARGE